MLADAGYISEANIAAAEKLGTDPLIATGKQKHGERPVAARSRPPTGLTPKQKMARMLLTKRGAAAFARRKEIVEPVFAQIKEARGFRQFLLRGVEEVRGEWALICLTHNML